MDYFRAATRTNEKSARVLSLIQDIIDMNPAHYTVWYVIGTRVDLTSQTQFLCRNYRQQVLFALNSNLEEELNYIDEIILDQAKNYQVW